jgi:hypothetical protein
MEEKPNAYKAPSSVPKCIRTGSRAERFWFGMFEVWLCIFLYGLFFIAINLVRIGLGLDPFISG